MTQPTIFDHINIKHKFASHGKPYGNPMLLTDKDLQKVYTVPSSPTTPCYRYTTSSSSTTTQFLHLPETSALAHQTHYPTFPRIVIPPQSHTPHLNTQDGYQQTTQRDTTSNDHNISLLEVKLYNNNSIEQHDGGDESNSSFLGQTNLYSIISCNIQWLNKNK